MNTSLDKIAYQLAYAYIILPFILFFINWLSPVYAIATTGIVIASYILMMRNTNSYIPINIKNKKYTIGLVLLILTVFMFFSGIGNYTFQNEDQQFRNAVFNDLVAKKWPYMINDNHRLSTSHGPALFIYYIIYWLPPAMAGKMLGLSAGYFFLFLWTLLGMGLTFYFICRYFRRVNVWLLLIFLTFDGLYLQFSFSKIPVLKALSSDYVTWTKDMRLADNILDGVYWIYNQTVVPWLVAAMLLNKTSTKNIFFLYALAYFHGPFFFIGLFPFVIVMVIRQIKEENIRSVMDFLKAYFSFQNVAGGLTVILIAFAFLSASPATEPLHFAYRSPKLYIPFTFAVFGLISLLIFNKYKKDPYFYIVVIVSALLPFIKMGTIQPFTFAARVSIATQFMLMILVAKYIIEEKGRMRMAVIAYCVVASMAAIGDVTRSAIFTIGYWTNRDATNKVLYDRSTKYGPRKEMFPEYRNDQNFLLQNDMKTLDTVYFTNGVTGVEKQDSNKFFMTRLMKK